jgi:hypothetical protein
VSEGDLKGFKVKFDLTFKDGGTLDNSKEVAGKEKINGISVGNTLTVGDGNKLTYFMPKENEETNAI